LVKNTEWVDLNNSNQEGPSKEGCVVDVAEIAATQKSGNSVQHHFFTTLLTCYLKMVNFLQGR
jgi:hypothetical protein